VPAEPVPVQPPKHPLHALTSYELRDYRRELEQAIALCGTKDPMSPAEADHRAKLDDVIAEQDDRKRLES
jgi:hypothetical protein